MGWAPTHSNRTTTSPPAPPISARCTTSTARPAFLAAYNTGPGRLDDFLTRNRALPHETRQYVSIIGPQIAGIYPNSRSQADLMVMNHQIGNGTMVAAAQSQTETRSVRMAWARRRDHESGSDQPIQVAEAPAAPGASQPAYQTAWSRIPAEPQGTAPANARIGAVWAARLAAAAPSAAAVAAQRTAAVAASQKTAAVAAMTPAISRPSPARNMPAAPQTRLAREIPARLATPQHARNFRLFEPAMAASAPILRGGADPAGARDLGAHDWGAHDWAIQVGAFGTVGQASEAVGAARSRVHALLPAAHTEIAGIRAGRAGAHVYRARLTGLSRNDAMQACQKLSRGRSECMVVSPDSRS